MQLDFNGMTYSPRLDWDWNWVYYINIVQHTHSLSFINEFVGDLAAGTEISVSRCEVQHTGAQDNILKNHSRVMSQRENGSIVVYILHLYLHLKAIVLKTVIQLPLLQRICGGNTEVIKS